MPSDIEGMGPGWCMGGGSAGAPAQDAGVAIPVEPSAPEQPLSLACVLQTACNVFIPMNKDKEML